MFTLYPCFNNLLWCPQHLFPTRLAPITLLLSLPLFIFIQVSILLSLALYMFKPITGSLILKQMNTYVPLCIYFIHIIRLSLLLLPYLMVHLCLFIMLVLLFFHLIFIFHMFCIPHHSKLTSYLFLKFINISIIISTFFLISV